MESQSFANRAGWIIVVYGLCLSFIASFAPFYEAGYLLKVDVLLASLSPYLVYAIVVPLLPGAITTTVGIVLAVAHTGLIVAVRFFEGADSAGLIYIVPIFLAVLVIPLVIIALIKTDVHKSMRRITGH